MHEKTKKEFLEAGFDKDPDDFARESFAKETIPESIKTHIYWIKRKRVSRTGGDYIIYSKTLIGHTVRNTSRFLNSIEGEWEKPIPVQDFDPETCKTRILQNTDRCETIPDIPYTDPDSIRKILD